MKNFGQLCEVKFVPKSLSNGRGIGEASLRRTEIENRFSDSSALRVDRSLSPFTSPTKPATYSGALVHGAVRLTSLMIASIAGKESFDANISSWTKDILTDERPDAETDGQIEENVMRHRRDSIDADLQTFASETAAVNSRLADSEDELRDVVRGW